MSSPAEKKRILIVGQHFWPEAFRINDIADYFVEHDVDVEVLCGIPNYPSGSFVNGYSYFKKRRQIHKSIQIHRAFEIPRGNNTNLRIFLNYVSFPIASLFHIPRLLTKKYDKIFIYQLSPVMMSITGIVLGKLTHTETTMYVLDLWPENLFSVLKIKNAFLRKAITRVSHWHYRHVDKLVALSSTMKKLLIEITRISADKIIVLPQAAEKIYETPIPDNSLKRRFKDKFTVLFTGNISPAQSFETIVNAAIIIKQSGYKDIHWIIVGDGMSRGAVEKSVQEHHLTDYFSFEGHHPIEDIPKYTNVADSLVGCLVKSNLIEATIPAKIMSYIASAKPLVLAMDGEIQELINTTIRGGYAGPSEDPGALATNIIKLYKSSPKERQQMGERLRNYHHNNFERNLLQERLRAFIFE